MQRTSSAPRARLTAWRARIVLLPCIVRAAAVAHDHAHNKARHRHHGEEALFPPFRSRAELGGILEELNLTTGAELGVERGIFSSQMLTNWPSVKEYTMCDLWSSSALKGSTPDGLEMGRLVPWLSAVARGEEPPLAQGSQAASAAGLKEMSIGFGSDGKQHNMVDGKEVNPDGTPMKKKKKKKAKKAAADKEEM